VINYYRETFECRSCRKNGLSYMEKSPVPDPVIQHSFASPSSVAWVMHQKFVNALPLYRQEKEWKTLGVNLSRATMVNWIIAASRDWLMPIVERMHQILLKEKYLHETPVQVLNEEGRKNTTKSYMWVYSTGQHCRHPIRIFDYRRAGVVCIRRNSSKDSKDFSTRMPIQDTRRLPILRDAFAGHI
jgi:hypothetical protein